MTLFQSSCTNMSVVLNSICESTAHCRNFILILLYSRHIMAWMFRSGYHLNGIKRISKQVQFLDEIFLPNLIVGTLLRTDRQSSCFG